MDSQRTAVAKELLLRLEARTRENPNDALAAFDFGYLVECYKQARWLHQHTDWLKASEDATGANLVTKIDGYSWVVKAITLRGSDPQGDKSPNLIPLSQIGGGPGVGGSKKKQALSGRPPDVRET